MAHDFDNARELPAYVLERLKAKSSELPVMPAAASRALQLTRDPNSSTTEFASIVEQDIKLATEVLAMANTPMFGVGQTVTSLGQAIVRLGFRQCRNLILTTSAASLIKRLPVEAAWVREVVCRHCFTTAAASRQLNHTLKLGFQGEEFTAGLLHDFGRILLAIVDFEKFKEADPLAFDESENADLLAQERAVFSTDHCEVGAWFAETCELPSELISPILNHHQFAEDDDSDELTLLTAAADHIANHVQRVESHDGYQPESNIALQRLEQKIGREIAADFEAALPSLVETVMTDVQNSQMGSATASRF